MRGPESAHLRGHPRDPVRAADDRRVGDAHRLRRPLRVREALRLLAEILTQGRAAGSLVMAVHPGAVQGRCRRPRSVHHQVCLGVTAASHVDMVLGEGARDRGAWPTRFPATRPCRYRVRVDAGSRLPVRFRAGWVTDDEIDELVMRCTPARRIRGSHRYDVSPGCRRIGRAGRGGLMYPDRIRAGQREARVLGALIALIAGTGVAGSAVPRPGSDDHVHGCRDRGARARGSARLMATAGVAPGSQRPNRGFWRARRL